MNKSSLLEIIRTFSKQELIKFEDFVKSPYFNKKENMLKLFFQIKKYAPDFDDRDLEKEKVWNALFPGKEYNYGIMKNLIFDLNKLLERYIIATKCEQDILSQSKYLLEYLNEKNLAKLFTNKFESIERTYDLDFFKRSNYNINLYYNFREEMAILRASVMNYTKHDDHKPTDIVSLYLIINFLINSFKVYQNLVVSNSGINLNFENNPVSYFLKQIGLKSFDNILENIKKISDTGYQYLKIYFKMYSMFKESNAENYLKFKNAVFENLKKLAKKDLRDLHFCLINGIDLVIKSEINVPIEKLIIFDSMITLNILKERNGVMNEHIFIYYVTLSYQEADIERLNKFSAKFISKLKEDIRSNANKYVEALNLLLKGKYEDCLSIVSQIDTNYFVMKLYLRYLKGRCIYKIGDYELFLSDYDSVKHFLNNNEKLNPRLKIKLEKYYYFLNILFKLRDNISRHELSRMEKEVMDFYNNGKNWFLIEISSLKNKYTEKLKDKS